MSGIIREKELVFLNQLFASLYEEDNYEKVFSTFLDNLRELVTFQKGDIYFYHNEDKHIVFDDFIFSEWQEDALADYINDYADLDDILPLVALNQPMMFKSSDIFLPDERMETKYYKELLAPKGMHHSIEGNIFNDGEGCIAGIGIHRPDELGDFTAKELEVLKLARPHLKNIARRFVETRVNIDSVSALTILQEIEDVGFCIFDDSFKPVDCTLMEGGLIAKDNIGEMMRSLITLCKSFAARIQSAGEDAKAENMKTHSRITIGKTAYYAEVTYRRQGKDSGMFIAMIYNRKDIMDKFICDLCDRYNLTERECEVLHCAIRGVSNADIAKEVFISVPTVKKHLTNIYTKMGIEGKHQILGAIMD